MAEMARKAALTHLIAPVRLSIKDPYPLAPIERCVAWIRDDSEPFDAETGTRA